MNITYCLVLLLLLLTGALNGQEAAKGHSANHPDVFIAGNSIDQEQDIPFERNYFKGKQRELRQARKHLRRGERFYQRGGNDLARALYHYQQAWQFNPHNAWVNFRLGDICLKTGRYNKAAAYLARSLKLENNNHQALFLLARACQLNYRFEEAIATFRKVRIESEEKKEIIDRHIAECLNGIELSANPGQATIENAGAALNSPWDDYNAIFSPDTRDIWFTSRRPDDRKAARDQKDNKYFETIYKAQRNDTGWHEPSPWDGPLNGVSHCAPAAIDAHGSSMIIFHSKEGSNLYEIRREDQQWNRPLKLPDGINSRYRETSAALSCDGNTLYFVSDRPGGQGGKDIWYVVRQATNTWSQPVNMGPAVNSALDEEGLFLGAGDTVLFFSSQGHNSMGGYDIFSSTLSNNQWSKAQNLGHPINSPGDDLFFRLEPDQHTGWFSSRRPDGFGGSDIYRVRFAESEVIAGVSYHAQTNQGSQQQQQAVPPMIILTGKVTDEAGNPLRASIDLYDYQQGQYLAQLQTNPQTGAYHLTIPAGKHYGMIIWKQRYLFQSNHFNASAANTYKEVERNFTLREAEAGQNITLSNIYFASGKSSLDSTSHPELEALYRVLAHNKTLKIKVCADIQENRKLSQKRVRSLLQYLRKKGISRTRMHYQLQEENAVKDAPSTSHEGRQKVEYEILLLPPQ